MTKTRLVGFSVALVALVCVPLAQALDIGTKKMLIKENLKNPAKRQVQLQSKDPAVLKALAVDPNLTGASIHVYSATDDLCVILESGANWVNKPKKWQYKSKITKNGAQVGDAKLLVKIKSGVTYTLADNGTQGTVNAQVKFGTGTKFCMRCTGNKKDDAKQFQGKDCVAAACDPEPSTCDAATPTTSSTTSTTSSSTSSSTIGTTTSTSSSTTTSTVPCTPMGVELKGALTATPGRFNYNLTLGLPGANAACNTSFPGTHACTYAELQTAAAACDLKNLKDTALVTVTSFWAIDNAQPPLQQCQDDALGGSNLNWEYGTAHTPSRGQKVPLNNAAGTLGALQSSLQCNLSGNSWVGCCI